MSAASKVIPMRPRRSTRSRSKQKVPATHGYCDGCGSLQEILVVPVEGPSPILYEAASIQCKRCRYTIAELFRQREIHE